MNLFKINFLFFICFLLIVSCSILFENNEFDNKSNDKSCNETRVIARVNSTGDLSELRLPVYEVLEDGKGIEYVLVIAELSEIISITTNYQVLETLSANSKPSDYQVLYAGLQGINHLAKEKIQMIYDDGINILAKGTDTEAADLSTLGFGFHRINKPIVFEKIGSRTATTRAAVNYNQTINTIMNSINIGDVRQQLEYLSGAEPVEIGGKMQTIGNRSYKKKGNSQATQYLYEFLQSLGLNTRYHTFTYSGKKYKNVICEITGTTEPNQIVYATAHFDAVPVSPGADDNASGCAALMQMAEKLRAYSFRKTIKLVFFNAEERGMKGSAAYVRDVATNENVKAAINMDMIGFDKNNDGAMNFNTRRSDLPGADVDLAIANLVIDVIDTYGLKSVLNPKIYQNSESRSDQKSFWDNGITCFAAREDRVSETNPHYHTKTDTVKNMTLDYCTNYIRAITGGVAHLAELTNQFDDTEDPTIPENLHITSITSNSVSLVWDASTDNVGITGYRIYQDETVVKTVNGFQATIEQLNCESQYSFSVTAIDAASNESEHSNVVNPTTVECGSGDNSVPGQIEAKDFSRQKGVTVNSGIITDIQKNEWTEYEIDVQSSGNYTVCVHVNRIYKKAGKITIMQGSQKLGTIKVNSPLKKWANVCINNIKLNAGKTTLRLKYTGKKKKKLFSIDWINFSL